MAMDNRTGAVRAYVGVKLSCLSVRYGNAKDTQAGGLGDEALSLCNGLE